ncbi:hypothetical protein K438DRAFT_1976057 [Mycena galopus ATCC 62051]|nr:hypothetical protein K438DRAFT_1976057 [Mycena galopus ATCC 62051]
MSFFPQSHPLFPELGKVPVVERAPRTSQTTPLTANERTPTSHAPTPVKRRATTSNEAAHFERPHAHPLQMRACLLRTPAPRCRPRLRSTPPPRPHLINVIAMLIGVHDHTPPLSLLSSLPPHSALPPLDCGAVGPIASSPSTARTVGTYLCRLHRASTLRHATATSAMGTHTLADMCYPLAPRTRLRPTTPPSLPSARVCIAAPLARHPPASTPPFASMSAARIDTHPPLAASRFTGR